MTDGLEQDIDGAVVQYRRDQTAAARAASMRSRMRAAEAKAAELLRGRGWSVTPPDPGEE